MIHLLRSLPWPVFLFISIIVATLIITHFISVRLRYSKFTVFGIILIGLSSFFVGILRIFELRNVDERHYQLIKYFPLIGFLGLGLLLIGGFKRGRDNPQVFRLVIIAGGMFLFSLIVVLLVIFL